MRTRQRSTLTAFVLFGILGSGALAQSESIPRREAEDPLALRDWAVDFSPLTTKAREVNERRVVENAVPSLASHFITVVPCRILDTRDPNGPFGGPIMGAGATRSYNVPAGPCPGIPTTASAYSLSFSVTQTAASGFLTAWPTGAAQPNAATMTWFGGSQTLTSAAIVPAGTSSSISVFAGQTTHVIIDINGYFVEGVVTSLTPGTGTTGGGTGAVTLGIANGGVGATQLGASAVTTGAIQDGAVTGAKIANSQVVRSVNAVTDGVTIAGSGTTSVTTMGSTIIVTGAAEVPAGTMILGPPNDTTLLDAGYSEVAPSGVEYWQPVATSGAPSARLYHTAVWTGTRMIVWGGESSAGPQNTGGQYDPVGNSWSATSLTAAPTGSYLHRAVWTGTKMIVWGGYDGTYLNTGGQYDPAGNSWSPTTTTGAPSGRFEHTAVWSGTKMVVWGGFNGSSLLNTGGQYDPVGDAWSPTTTTGAPSARYLHTAVWSGTKMIVWGGIDVITYANTGGQYDPAGDSWIPTTLTAAPLGRYLHTAVWSGTNMIVWGGNGSGGLQNTGGRYHPASDSWTVTTVTGAPSARQYHTAVWSGTTMVVWGGVDGGNAKTGGQYDPAGDSWSPTTLVGAPSARQRHVAVWSGTRMIVWGGYDGAYVGSGGRWGMLSLYRRN